VVLAEQKVDEGGKEGVCSGGKEGFRDLTTTGVRGNVNRRGSQRRKAKS